MTLPNALTTFRLFAAPGLILLAFTGRSLLVLAALLLLQVTDWIDGPLARRSSGQSAAGARLDSLADAVMFGSALVAVAVLEGQVLLGEWPWIGVALASYLVSVLYARARFGMVPTYHQWSAKVSGPVTLLAVFAVLLDGLAWPVRVAAAVVTLANLEAVWITRRLDAPATDLPFAFGWERDAGQEASGESREVGAEGRDVGGSPWREGWPWIGGGLAATGLLIWFVVIPYPWGLASGDPGPTALMEQRVREAHEAGDSLVIRREWVDLDQIAQAMRRAVVVAEDYRFREHEGVDWVSLAEEVRWTGDEDFSWLSPGDLAALARAFGYAWTHRAELRGRSTITQQLAKNLYFGTDRSLARKAMELVVARRLERQLEKDRILELYLNAAEWGPGIFGVEAAARQYFGRPASNLTLAQAAALAGTLPHPLTSNPAYRPARMAWRRDLILSRLSPSGTGVPGPIPEPPADLVIPDSVRTPLTEALDAMQPSSDSVSVGVPAADSASAVPPEGDSGMVAPPPGDSVGPDSVGPDSTGADSVSRPPGGGA